MSVCILAFNTTTTLCSVALMIDQHVYTHSITVARHHSEKVLCIIDQLLSEVGVTLQSLDCLIVDRGPGSFAGVRIGVSAAQGLALGADLPLIEVSSLVVLAQGAWRVFGAEKVVTTINARVGELYWADHVRTIDNRWVFHNHEMLVTTMHIQQLMYSLRGNWVLVGTGWNNYSDLICGHSEDLVFLKKNVMFPEAQDMFAVGMYQWENKLFVSPSQIKPVYLSHKLFVKKF